MKERPTIFIAACIILSVCMSAFLQCASRQSFSEVQGDLVVEDNAHNLTGEKQALHFVTETGAEK